MLARSWAPDADVGEGVVDDWQLRNPLERSKRLETGWMGVLVEAEGALLPDAAAGHARAWRCLALELGRPPPARWQLDRASRLSTVQALREVFRWGGIDPVKTRELAGRFEALYRAGALAEQDPEAALTSNMSIEAASRDAGTVGDAAWAERWRPVEVPGARRLLETLRSQGVPVALVSPSPEARLRPALERLGLAGPRPAPAWAVRDQSDIDASADAAPEAHLSTALLTYEDASAARPDPDLYLAACRELGRPPLRTVVVANCNQSIEAAREIGARAVCLAGRDGGSPPLPPALLPLWSTHTGVDIATGLATGAEPRPLDGGSGSNGGEFSGHPAYELSAADLVVSSLTSLTFTDFKGLFGDEGTRAPQGDAQELLAALEAGERGVDDPDALDERDAEGGVTGRPGELWDEVMAEAEVAWDDSRYGEVREKRYRQRRGGGGGGYQPQREAEIETGGGGWGGWAPRERSTTVRDGPERSPGRFDGR